MRDDIAANIHTIAAEPDVVARLGCTGQVINPGMPTEFRAALDEQRATVAAIGKDSGNQGGELGCVLNLTLFVPSSTGQSDRCGR